MNPDYYGIYESEGRKMYTVLSYVFTFFVIVITVLITLFFKNELERMFQKKKDALPFHICNLLITFMVSFAAHAVMTIYVTGDEFNWIVQPVILLFIIFPVYLIGHLAFEKYNVVYHKYITAENGKVIILNDKYLKKKKWPSKFRNYNAISKEK